MARLGKVYLRRGRIPPLGRQCVEVLVEPFVVVDDVRYVCVRRHWCGA